MTFFTCIIFALSGIISLDFQPPPYGIGSEILPLNSRSYGMGGVCVGLPFETGFSMLNPAASAWTSGGGVNLTGRYSEGDDEDWDNHFGFPKVSAFLSLPGGIVLSGAIDSRSRTETEMQETVGDGCYGEFSWSGGLVESYAGLSFKACDWLAFSFGGRGTFGDIMSEVTLISTDSVSTLQSDSIYRDDASFRMAYGGVFGILINTERFGLGFSITTDRKGSLDIDRDFLSAGTANIYSGIYSLPGEISAGISFKPVDRILIGMDVYSRKAVNILDNRTDNGSIYSVGAEIDAGHGIAARTGFSHMDGLWRDGAQTFTAGAGYSFSDNRAGIDFAAGYQYWRDVQDRFQEETVLCISLWATERWLE